MDIKLDPSRDDLPLMANTSHMLVKHYILDLDVDFGNRVIEGNIVLFFGDGNKFKKHSSSTQETFQMESEEAYIFRTVEPCHVPDVDSSTFSPKMGHREFAVCGKGDQDAFDNDGNHDNQEHDSEFSSSKYCCDTGNHGREDFLLVLDCCDLSVLKVEEVDVAAVPGLEKFTKAPKLSATPEKLRREIVRDLVALPADAWREQLDCYTRCSQAPGCGELLFNSDNWSLQIRKMGAPTAADFPHAIRIWYKTKPEGQSVAWTSDQNGRPCVYTMGSPINNRALFPCQEPPVAMSTWQATVRAAASFVVLMSGENSAKPTALREGYMSWHYYVTMPMPASTFAIAVGCWTEMKLDTSPSDDWMTEHTLPLPASEADFRYDNTCSHVEYPCRFQSASAAAQDIIPYRVFAPVCLEGACRKALLPLIPPCLSAAHSVLGTHPFSRLDILIVPTNFPSLGMASPHIIFLSQSTLTGTSHLCGTRLCHEIAHAWFGLAIGARDWTEEWLSEGFATHLEDIFWAEAQQLPRHEALEQQQLRACLRQRRLQDELRNSPEGMQVLRPNKEETGHVSASGASVVKHGLNPEKGFMQVHYLKGYFLLRFLASTFGEETYFPFLRKFVHLFHGQLILSQDFLQMLLESIPENKRMGLSVENIIRDWLECSGIPKALQEELKAEDCSRSRLTRQVGAEVAKWIRVNRRKRKRGKREAAFEKLSPDQIILLLEWLLEQKTLSPQTLHCLQQTYHLQEQDSEGVVRRGSVQGLEGSIVVSPLRAEAFLSMLYRHHLLRDYIAAMGGRAVLAGVTVSASSKSPLFSRDQVRHRWCELVIRHKYTKAYDQVKRFLQEDQAMGIYLYGELMLSEDARLQQLAHRCFELVKEHMDKASAQVVTEMLF